MLTLYRKKDCPRCSRIQETLEDLSVSHRVTTVTEPADIPDRLAAKRLPLLVHDDKIFEGASSVSNHLQEIEEFKRKWYKFQSDACYCDDKGNIE
ncbi:MAG: glutathione S-transferase N-terminal domain-containing protein [Planctomycetota bacterium]